MEGNYLWEVWCNKKGLPKTYGEVQEIYPNAETVLIDGFWESMLQEYEEEEVVLSKKKLIGETLLNVTFVKDIFSKCNEKGIDSIIFHDHRFDRFFVRAIYPDSSEVLVDITNVNEICKPRIILATLYNNFKYIDGIIMYRKEMP